MGCFFPVYFSISPVVRIVGHVPSKAFSLCFVLFHFSFFSLFFYFLSHFQAVVPFSPSSPFINLSRDNWVETRFSLLFSLPSPIDFRTGWFPCYFLWQFTKKLQYTMKMQNLWNRPVDFFPSKTTNKTKKMFLAPQSFNGHHIMVKWHYVHM